MTCQALQPRRSAFTLIELIVVVVLIGVLAGLVAPRLLTTERRRAEATVTDLTSMLSVVARRDALGNSRMALEYDAERGDVKLDTLRVEGERFGSRQTAWRPDPLTPRVELQGIEITETRVDGYPTGEKWWRIEFAPGVPRPLIELVVQYKGDRPKAWLIELLPYAPEAEAITVVAGEQATRSPRSVDLDDLGRSDVPW